MSKANNSTIVVKKKKGGGHGGHHGGSWKIAYADFMTAMMALFLVLWLLSTSSPATREQIAEYFKMPLSVALAGGTKSSVGSNVIPGGGDNIIKQDGEVFKQNLKKLNNKDDRNDKKLQGLREKLTSLIKQDPRLSNFQSNLRLSLTENGLLIQITDSHDRPMFKVGSREPEPYMRAILQALAPALNELPNRITLSGHTDSLRFSGGDGAYGNWELSTERANASRRALISGGLTADKFLRIIGMADSVSIDGGNDDDPLNRRITILVHTKENEAEILKEDSLLNKLTATPETENLKPELKIMPPDSVPSGRSVQHSAITQEQVEKDGHQ